MKRNILYIILPALLLAACDSDDMGGPSPAAQDGEQIRFEISLRGTSLRATSLRGAAGDAANHAANQSDTLDCFGTSPRNDDAPSLRAEPLAARNEAGGNTRATTTAFKTAWDAGDRVGLFIVKGDGGLQASNWVDNLPMTYDGAAWNYTLPADKAHYPGGELHFYAYYPYDDTLADPTAHTFRVQADQRREQDYNRSDLLTAKAENVTRSSNPVALQFSHALSLVQVAVLREVNVPLFVDDDFTVTLTGVLPDATLGWSHPPAATGTPTGITMHKVPGMDYTYRALVPAQTLAADSKVTFVQTTADKEIDMWYNGLASATLTAGQAHQHNVTLGWRIDPDHVYAVKDPYPHVGPTIGIVFYIENNGKNGLAIGLTENDGVKWADAHDRTGAQNFYNGRANMQKIYSLANDFSGYPAFEWVHAMNPPGTDYSDESATGIWYLPAVSEWLDFSSSVRNAVNPALTKVGGTALSDIFYWSSTENSSYSNTAYVNSSSTGNNKTDLLKARAIIAF